MHKRQAIREAIKTELDSIAGLTVLENRVHTNTSFPLANVKTARETSDASEMGGLVLTRELLVDIELTGRAVADVDDDIDGLCESVEIQLANNPTLGGVCDYLFLTSTDIDFDGDGEQPHGRAVLTFNVHYSTLSNNPST